MDLRFSTVLPVLAFAFGLAGPTLAQGSDNCATPTTISGAGTFPINTTGATNSPQQPGSCPTVNRDVWFRWTATSGGPMIVSLCGGTSVDTVAAVYNGSSCPT